MVAPARSFYPLIETERIYVSKSNTNKGILDLKINLLLRASTRVNTSLYQKFISSANVYFMVLTDKEVSVLWPMISGPQRKLAMQNIVKYKYYNIYDKHEKYIKKPISEVLSRDYNLSSKKSTTIRCQVDLTYYMNKGLELGQNKELTRGLHLVCFVDSEDFSTQSEISNVSYDLVLNSTTPGQKMKIPTKRRIYIVNDPRYPIMNRKPYLGPVHYHGSSNPGLDGYIGFMAGAGGQDMGPKLISTEVDNHKILSLAAKSRFTKLTTPLETSTSFFDTGQDLEDYVKSINFFEKYRQFRTKDLVLSSIISGAKDSQSFITKETADTGHFRVIRGTGKSPLNNSFCASLIGIDLAAAIKNNSEIGNFLQFHMHRKNKEIVRSIINFSEIIDLKIRRIRVSKDTNHINKQKTRVLGDYKKNQEETILLHTNDIAMGMIGSATNAKAQLDQVDIVSLGSLKTPRHVRSIYLKDYDLFHNFDAGLYTYEVDLQIKDGISEYLKLLVNNMEDVLPLYSQYVNACSLPVVYSSQGRYLYGNYNFDRNMPHPTFKNYSSEYEGILSNSLKVYSECYKFLTGTETNTDQLAISISPKVVDLEKIKNLLSDMKNMKEIMISTLRQFSSYQPENASSLQKTDVSTKQSFKKVNIIEISAKTNILHDLSHLSEILVDNLPLNLNSKTIPKISDLMRKMNKKNIRQVYSASEKNFASFLPSSFIEIPKESYLIVDDSVQVLPKIRALATHDPRFMFDKQLGVQKYILDVSPIRTLMTKNRYDNLSEKEKLVIDTKISAIKMSLGLRASIKDKPEEFFPSFIQDTGSSLTISAMGFSRNSIQEDKEKAIEKTLNKIVPDMSSKLQESLINSLHNSKTKEEFNKSINDNFKELIGLSDALGTFYGTFHNYLSFSKILNKQRSKKVDYREMFLKGRSQALNYETEDELLQEDIFEAEQFTASYLVPGKGTFDLSDEQIEFISKDSLTQRPGYVFLKLDSKIDNKIPAVNGCLLVRI